MARYLNIAMLGLIGLAANGFAQQPEKREKTEITKATFQVTGLH